MIQTQGDNLNIRFESFGAQEYDLFLKCKRLPESRIAYDYERDLYTIETHQRYAPLLGLVEETRTEKAIAFPAFLFEHQVQILKLTLNAKRFAVWTDCGLGKGQPHGSKVLTPLGWREIQTLQVGDLIIASNGKPHTVTGVFPKEGQKTYRVHFSDKTSFVVDEDHLHIVRTNNDRRRNKSWRVLSTKDLLTSNLRYGASGKSRNFDIPVVQPVQFGRYTVCDLLIPPYLLGVLLGDGCIKYQSSISTPDTEIINAVKEILGDRYELKQKTANDWSIVYRKHGQNPLTDKLRRLRLFGKGSNEKFVPSEYLYASVEDRLELLRGLMDTDGYIKNSSQFYTTSSQLADDVMFLIRSLGGVPTQAIKKAPTYTYKKERRIGQDCHIITFSLKTFNPFRLTRKAKLWNPNPRDNGRWIDRIEFESVQPTVCISVDSSDSSYVTEHFIVTHNTLCELEFARQVAHRTGGRCLILTLNEIVEQTIEEAQKFYGDDLPVLRLNSRAEMRLWCKGEFAPEYSIAITNYEKMNPDADGQDVPELRFLAGFILDESSRLKASGGKQKWAIVKSAKGIPYKLSCTATPAPNDYIEFASQASFLERMRSENEIIWTFFAKDKQTGEWTVKRHARHAFFEWMSSWSIYVHDPRAFGWSSDLVLPPEPEILRHEIEATCEQVEEARLFNLNGKGQPSLFVNDTQGIVGRSKHSQIAKGFVYLKGNQIRRIDSAKPDFVANLIRAEKERGLQVLVWTVFDEESSILAEALQRQEMAEEDFAVLSGKDKPARRTQILHDFRGGKLPVLISKAALLGYGMNFQNCGSMIFSGWNDSFESFYQAVRRAVRYGQDKAVRIHLPFIRELEYAQLANVFRKQGKFETAIAAQEQAYIKAMRGLQLL